LELPFAKELDKLKLPWCRNPSRSGFGIPLLSLGQSKTFYPDFLVWKAKHVFALDTTGEHILQDKLGRKLLRIEPHPKSKIKLLVRLISKGNWDDKPQRVSAEGFTVWTLGQANALKPLHVATMDEAVKVALRPDN
jgi:type III restriction enzyme